MTVLVILFYLLFPAFLLFLSTKFPIVNKIGVVVFCYLGGLLIGNVNVIPESTGEIQGSLMGVAILLGIPLVMFSENILKWVKVARYTFLSLILGVVSVVVMVFLGFFILKDYLPEAWKLGGMLIGVYTGGTPNLAAIAQSLSVDEDMYILTHTVDLAFGAIVLLFLISVAQRFFGLFLKPYVSSGDYDESRADAMAAEFESYNGFLSRNSLPDLFKSFGLSILVFGAGYLVMTLFDDEEVGSTAAVLTVTTLGILLSLVPRINENKKSFKLGMYFIYVFSVIVASKANLNELFSPESWGVLKYLMIYVGLAMIGSLFFHALLSKIFRINNDDFIMTSCALSNSPPFVPVVAAALKNKEVMIPGMIIGVLGYAIGNYLGVAVAYVLKGMM